VFLAELVHRVGWEWSSRDISDLIEGQVMFALLSPIWNGLALGILVGCLNATAKDRSMGTFRGTLPVSDRWQANQLLRAALSGFLASWVIAIAWAAIVLVIVQATFGREPIQLAWHKLPGDWRILGPVLMSLFGGWAALGAVLSAALTGRVWLQTLPAYACGLVGIYGAGVAPHVSLETTRTVALMFGVALIYGWVACGYSAALARGLLTWRDVGVAAAVWVIGTVATLILASGDVNGNPLLVIGNLLVTAAVAPWASAPLALALNRHR
jgi:hypothetical protein